MSYFDDASLVMIPSGYKTSKVYSVKPTDGSGDLTFSRSNDTATRVNSAGLIEKVRTNVILQSNTFNTTWLATDATVTSGATDPNGGTTAWTLANTAASGIIQQTATLAGLRSVSIYAKAGTHRYLYMGAYAGSGANSYQVFDLQDGVITSGSKGRIESIGGGWYRCTSFGADGTAGGVQIFPSNNSLGAGTTNGNILIWRCQYEAGDIATDYIATTSAAVSVGPVANVPRLDYLNSSCPRLLLEPQRTSLVLFSESFDNAAWNKNNTSVTANQAVSPDGYTNADKLVENSSSSFHDTNQQSITYTAAAYTISVFAKAAGRNHIFLQIFDGVTFYTSGTFNLSNGTVSGSGSIVSYGNGWYRCSFTATTASSSGGAYINLSNGTTGNYTGNGTSGVFLYGAQVELGAYATSYIPTLGAAVTRGADACSKTGISSLIGQTEGTIFVEFKFDYSDSNTQVLFKANQTTDANSVGIEVQGTTIKGLVNSGGGNIATITGTIATGTIKAALAYKTNDMAFYVNGTQVGVDTSGSIAFAGVVDILTIGQFLLNGGTFFPASRPFNQALLFKTRLSNADLAALTA